MGQDILPTVALCSQFPYGNAVGLYRALYPQLLCAEMLNSANSGPESRPLSSTAIYTECGNIRKPPTKLKERNYF